MVMKPDIRAGADLHPMGFGSEKKILMLAQLETIVPLHCQQGVGPSQEEVRYEINHDAIAIPPIGPVLHKEGIILDANSPAKIQLKPVRVDRVLPGNEIVPPLEAAHQEGVEITPPIHGK